MKNFNAILEEDETERNEVIIEVPVGVFKRNPERKIQRKRDLKRRRVKNSKLVP